MHHLQDGGHLLNFTGVNWYKLPPPCGLVGQLSVALLVTQRITFPTIPSALGVCAVGDNSCPRKTQTPRCQRGIRIHPGSISQKITQTKMMRPEFVRLLLGKKPSAQFLQKFGLHDGPDQLSCQMASGEQLNRCLHGCGNKYREWNPRLSFSRWRLVDIETRLLQRVSQERRSSL